MNNKVEYAICDRYGKLLNQGDKEYINKCFGFTKYRITNMINKQKIRGISSRAKYKVHVIYPRYKVYECINGEKKLVHEGGLHQTLDYLCIEPTSFYNKLANQPKRKNCRYWVDKYYPRYGELYEQL